MKTLLLLSICATLQGELLDRVAVTIGNQVITESELKQEIKLNAFLNREKADFSPASKRAAADRLIEQKLVKKEMELGSYPSASPAEASAMLDKLLKTRAHDKAEFDQELSAAGITLTELEEHLLWGLTLAHFIDVRFRPAVQVTNRDVEKYFEEHVIPNSRGTQKPDLESMRTQIEETIAGERSDERLNAWMNETRAHSVVVYHKEVFGAEGNP
jgi:hypothetical protein